MITRISGCALAILLFSAWQASGQEGLCATQISGQYTRTCQSNGCGPYQLTLHIYQPAGYNQSGWWSAYWHPYCCGTDVSDCQLGTSPCFVAELRDPAVRDELARLAKDHGNSLLVATCGNDYVLYAPEPAGVRAAAASWMESIANGPRLALP